MQTKVLIRWSVPVHDEFVRLVYLSDEEEKILGSWMKGKSVVAQSIEYNMSESSVKYIRKNIINKYKDVMKFSSILQDAWNR